jgi:hypothetical protein
MMLVATVMSPLAAVTQSFNERTLCPTSRPISHRKLRNVSTKVFTRR